MYLRKKAKRKLLPLRKAPATDTTTTYRSLISSCSSTSVSRSSSSRNVCSSADLTICSGFAIGSPPISWYKRSWTERRSEHMERKEKEMGPVQLFFIINPTLSIKSHAVYHDHNETAAQSVVSCLNVDNTQKVNGTVKKIVIDGNLKWDYFGEKTNLLWRVIKVGLLLTSLRPISIGQIFGIRPHPSGYSPKWGHQSAFINHTLCRKNKNPPKVTSRRMKFVN